ncbi:uncharacterized protein LOC121572720 [Coregonus clupeaformis]|uniref:uncharacterized protein LOC121572720 n=1 Tax=Coregonus clupeaformis TaxID=59861 RepID=UPI001E1C3838|nr:uncharacterized protein LOC121572720 [Coregonus clupeaformis]
MQQLLFMGSLVVQDEETLLLCGRGSLQETIGPGGSGGYRGDSQPGRAPLGSSVDTTESVKWGRFEPQSLTQVLVQQSTQGCEILEQQRDEANQKLKEIEEGDGCCRAAVPDRTLMQRECRGPHCQVVVYYGYCSSSCDSVGTPKNVSMMSSTKPVTKENKVLKRRSQALLPLISELPKNMATMTFNLESDQGMDPILKKLSKQNKNMNKMKRVSQLVTEDFTEITQKLELAQCLRQHAEVFAHQVLVKQKETQRQSMALQQSSETSLQLQQALEQVAHISSTLQDMQRYYRNQSPCCPAQQEEGVSQQH